MSHLPPQNFVMVSGDSKIINVTITDPDTNAPLDLTGVQSVIWKLARTVKSAPVLFKSLAVDTLAQTNPPTDLTPPGGIEVTNDVGGVLEITLDPTDTELLFNSYYHELQIVDAADNKRTVMVGTITIDSDLVTE